MKSQPTALTYTIEDSDESLLTEYARTGDRKLFETLMRRYQSEIYGDLRRFLGRDDLAEDVFQPTFLQVHLKCGQFDPIRKVRPWLYAIATNAAIDAQRRARRNRMTSLDLPAPDSQSRTASWGDQLASPSPDPAAISQSQEERNWLRGAVDSLGDSYAAVIQLVYFQGLKYREAAEILSIPVGTVKSRLHSALAKLSDQWRERKVGSTIASR